MGVLFDQGVTAEQAWAAPYRLFQRLGHLDASLIAKMDPTEMSDVIARPPALHRFVNQMGRYIVLSWRHLVDHYAGDSRNIWSDCPTAKVLDARLREFHGISQKKAAMAVALLTKSFMIPVQDMDQVDVAYDVHVRRVFLRTGLVENDSMQEVLTAARNLSPEFPGALDLPTWAIGRQWCRPQQPLCETCPLGSLCPSRHGVVMNQLPVFDGLQLMFNLAAGTGRFS